MVLYAGHQWVDDDPTKPLSAARVSEMDNAVVAAHDEIATLQARIFPVQQITYAATITPDAATGSVFYCVATGNLALAEPANAIDGKHITVAVQASGANRTLTLPDGSTVPIPSGEWWIGKLLYLGTPAVWLLAEGV